VDVQTNRMDIEAKWGDILGNINGNHEKRRTREMEDNTAWISALRIRYESRQVDCRYGRKGYDYLRDKESIMATNALPTHECVHILHLMEQLLGGMGIRGRNRYNQSNYTQAHSLLHLDPHNSNSSKINLEQGKGREGTKKRISGKTPDKNKIMARLKHTVRKGKHLRRESQKY